MAPTSGLKLTPKSSSQSTSVGRSAGVSRTGEVYNTQCRTSRTPSFLKCSWNQSMSMLTMTAARSSRSAGSLQHNSRVLQRAGSLCLSEGVCRLRVWVSELKRRTPRNQAVVTLGCTSGSKTQRRLERTSTMSASHLWARRGNSLATATCLTLGSLQYLSVPRDCNQTPT